MVSFSGGKDSTVMLLKMLELGMQVDMVLFCDTGLEFPALYDHVKKVEKDTGVKITTVKLKDEPRRKYLHELQKKYDIIEYIGIAADEIERITHKCNSRLNVRLPLVEWGMTEAECLKYCKEKGYDW